MQRGGEGRRGEESRGRSCGDVGGPHCDIWGHCRQWVRDGEGRGGERRGGQGRAGQGRAGQGRAGQGSGG